MALRVEPVVWFSLSHGPLFRGFRTAAYPTWYVCRSSSGPNQGSGGGSEMGNVGPQFRNVTSSAGWHRRKRKTEIEIHETGQPALTSSAVRPPHRVLPYICTHTLWAVTGPSWMRPERWADALSRITASRCRPLHTTPLPKARGVAVYGTQPRARRERLDVNRMLGELLPKGSPLRGPRTGPVMRHTSRPRPRMPVESRLTCARRQEAAGARARPSACLTTQFDRYGVTPTGIWAQFF